MSEAPRPSDSTCWTLIQSAAANPGDDRETFARRYVSVVRAYLAHRWRKSRLIEELDDVVQEVFMECFRDDGVLDRIQQDRPASFRAFLYGVTRHVALRAERRIGKQGERQRGGGVEADEFESEDASMSRVFDRSWAITLMRQAGGLQEERAAQDPRLRRRVELLQLRSRESLPIRDIAKLWDEDAAFVHKEYARARADFRSALCEVLAFHYPGRTAAEIDEKCIELLELLKS